VAAYGLCLALRADASTDAMERDAAMLAETRPTAINLRWALERMTAALHNLPASDRVAAAYAEAAAICDDDVETCRKIGEHGLPLLREIAGRKGRVNVLTHCNAGWIATVDYGTALSPIYQAHDLGLDVHVSGRAFSDGSSFSAQRFLHEMGGLLWFHVWDRWFLLAPDDGA
jgi:methylthioribose-1-phosphate isomerase